MRTFDVQPDRTFTFYGGARDFCRYKEPEAIIHGPAETGKTISALWKLNLCALKYDNASLVIARKTLASTHGSVLVTFQNKVLGGPDERLWPCKKYGGEKAEWFDYRNGSRIWITGLDKSSKVLSSEHDIIYVNQAEELDLDDWETLTTRTTGRAGNMPYSQTIGDCNPAWPLHWIYHRPTLELFYSRHQENPALYDQTTGEITEQGKRTMGVLEALTGVRKDRLLYGKPAQAEGAVYDAWDEPLHYINADQVPPLSRYIMAQDWGYTHAGVLGLWGIDGDGRMYLEAQVYHTKRNIDWWTKWARELHKETGYTTEAIACDPSEPAYIDAYKAKGLPAVKADNSVRPGIDAVQRRLAKAGDGRPRLFIVRDSLRVVDPQLREAKLPYATEHEFPAYIWRDTAKREEPVKENDHGMDMVRYAVMYVDGGRDYGPMGTARYA